MMRCKPGPGKSLGELCGHRGEEVKPRVGTPTSREIWETERLGCNTMTPARQPRVHAYSPRAQQKAGATCASLIRGAATTVESGSATPTPHHICKTPTSNGRGSGLERELRFHRRNSRLA